MWIGILADSHGNEAATERAAAVLLERGAVCLIHLGDLCESMDGKLTEGMLALALRHRITVIKGNNDLAVERLLDENPSRSQEENTSRDFLKNLPLRVAVDDLLFAHSMPDGTVRSVYDPIDDGGVDRAAEVFARTTFTALFRLKQGKVIRKPVPPAEDLPLLPEERYIIVAGSVAEGECALLETERRIYRRIPLF